MAVIRLRMFRHDYVSARYKYRESHLVGVEDFRHAIARQRFPHRLDAEVRRQRVRQPPGQDPSAGPIHDSKQVYEAASHWDVGNVCRPDLVWPGDREMAQQVRVDRVGRGLFAFRAMYDDKLVGFAVCVEKVYI